MTRRWDPMFRSFVLSQAQWVEAERALAELQSIATELAKARGREDTQRDTNHGDRG